jgi:hypothetical protein
MKQLLIPLLIVAVASAQRDELQIVILGGDGAFNNIRRGLGRDIEVEVRDSSGRLVEGAQVTFSLPVQGPGAFFANGSKTQRAVTGSSGRAATSGLTPNHIEGRFNVRVRAELNGKSATAVVSQSNTSAGGITPETPERKSKKWIILGLLGGGVAGGAFAFAGRSGGSSASSLPPPTTINLGQITVGGPR